MIGKIKGILSEVRANTGLIETASGLFYDVFLTPQLISAYKVGQPIEIYTYLQIRDDAHVLFGFPTSASYELFKMLLSVSGVGPKTAYLVVANVAIDELFSAIKANDADFFKKIPGLGKKTSMKIILELSQKLKSEFQMEKMSISADDQTVVDALISLGYKAQEARTVLMKIPKDLSVEEKIQFALRLSMKHKKEV